MIHVISIVIFFSTYLAATVKPGSIKFEKIKASLGDTKLIGKIGVRKNSDEPININTPSKDIKPIDCC